MGTESICIAFVLTLFAGLSTGIGSIIAFFAKSTNTKFLSISLGFSAGVMIYVSFAEIFPEAMESLIADLGEKKGAWIAVAAFFGGILVAALIDRLVPSSENPHEIRTVEETDKIKNNSKKLFRMGIFSALAIAIHNFPEGIATFTTAVSDIKIGFAIAIAIAIHNIPEGIAVSVPIFFATRSKRKALWYSFLSGLSEPLGALIGYLILMPFMNDTVFGVLFASTAGIMVFISLDELLPAARELGQHHWSVYGLIAGMVIMAISLLLLM